MVKPPPFKRPSVIVSGHGREWRLVHPCDLQAGDTVQDKGLIKRAEVLQDLQDREFINLVVFISGEVRRYHRCSDRVLAHVQNKEERAS